MAQLCVAVLGCSGGGSVSNEGQEQGQEAEPMAMEGGAGRRLFAKIISGTDASSLERAVNAALASIPLTARPAVSMIAPLGDRVRLYAMVTYIASEAEAGAAVKAAEERRRRMNINYETLK
jgi:hypothetical protein